MSKPLVSIVMNCFNGEKFLKRALTSIINQKYYNWELIFWDNLSTDQSKNIFLSFDDKRFKYFCSKKFKKLYDARNDALEKCNGKYISFLDVDDCWLEEKLSKQVELLEKNKDTGLVYSNFLTVNLNRFFFKKKEMNIKTFKSGIITEYLMKNYFIGLLTVMIRKSSMKDDLSNFDSKYNMLSDFDYILRFSKINKIDFIGDTLAIYNQHKDQLQLKNISIQACQFNEWFKKKVVEKKIFGENKNFSNLEKRRDFLNFLKNAENKNILINLKDLFFYKNNINKVKLFFIVLLPKNLIEKIFSLT